MNPLFHIQPNWAIMVALRGGLRGLECGAPSDCTVGRFSGACLCCQMVEAKNSGDESHDCRDSGTYFFATCIAQGARTACGTSDMS